MNIATLIPLADSWMHGGWGWGWMTLIMVFMVLFWGAVIFAIVWLIRGASWSGSAPRETPERKETPVEILDRRFAEGSITLEDYQERREVLVDGTQTAEQVEARGEPVGKT